MEPGEQKRALRDRIRQEILAMDSTVRLGIEADIRSRCWEAPGLAAARTILLYASAFPEEIATAPLLRRVRDEGRTLLCPRVDRRQRRLRLFQIDRPDRDLRPGRLGIPEPSDDCQEVDAGAIDWVLVPGLAFDRRGYRLGRGGGYYDRLLAELADDIPRWSLALPPQLVEGLPIEPHDRRVHGLILATGCLAASPATQRSA